MKSKRITSMFLALAMVLSFLPAYSLMARAEWNGTTIASLDDLKEFCRHGQQRR